MKCSAYHIFFKNLASAVKTQIIISLKNKEKSVGDLSTELNLEQSKVSHALANLRFCNIVVVKQIGKNRIYSLNKQTIVPILKIIDEHGTIHCKGCKK